MVIGTKVNAFDICLAVLIAPCAILFALLHTILRRLTWNNDIPFGTDIYRSIVRNLFSLPESVLIKLGSFSGADDVLQSVRFHSVNNELCREVRATNFTGYWICQGPPGRSQSAATCDATVLYIHGGAYVTGHPLSSLASLLRVSEVLSIHGLTISIFALSYPLAGEATFPKQQEHALAAYKYLLGDAKVAASKIIVLGESAGGHLAISMLHDIAEVQLDKPGGALLLCPWVNLSNTGLSFERNEYRDVLTKGLLDRCANAVDPPRGSAGYGKMHDFTAEGFRWRDILPAHTIVSVGTHDVFVDDIIAFKQRAEEQNAHIVLELVSAKPHGWQFSTDRKSNQHYLQVGSNEPISRSLEGAENMSSNLLSIMKTL